ncbi:MAG: hypothetical protein FWF80_00630 [Defluviitaleaceae bacterium]|nr:hypothetical protein [Defluviitaleaceae bacterium]
MAKIKNLFIKKRPRKRTIAPYSERYKDRYKDEDNVLQFNQDPNAPKILETRTQRFTDVREAFKTFPWMRLTITFLIILVGGIGSAAFAARNADINREVSRAEQQLRDYRNLNFALEQSLLERHTFDEIERGAIALGMVHPDPSMIIPIHVPRVGGVTLNTADYALPRHNYFWNDARDFLGGIINQLFGARQA